jgi:SAM-dependent methyltransferase
MSDTPAPLSAADWAGENGRRWLRNAERLEAELGAVNPLLFAAARLVPGERVLDVGCGPGSTTRRAAELVAPGGTVTGLDVSPVLIEAAAAVPAAGAPITWRVADAQRAPLDAEFDVVLSRFGVMFFDDPVAALANLRGALRPGGRFVAAVWQRRQGNELMELPLDAVVAAAAAAGVTLPVPDPDSGPFSWGDPARVRALLDRAGWRGIEVVPHELTMHVGGASTLEDAVAVAVQVGPARLAYEAADEPLRAALAERLAPRFDGTGVAPRAAIHLVHAEA